MDKMTMAGITKNGTRVYFHPEGHPHRPDLAEEALALMEVPERPADPTDRRQTRAAATVDLGRTIGLNHRVERRPGMHCFFMVRGEGPEKRNYPSIMTLDADPEPETRLTMVCFWDQENDGWVLYTNHEGKEDPWPEPGTVRFNHLSDADKEAAKEWHMNHPLACTEEEKLLCLRRPTRKAD